jgi:hypothetical protein
MRQIIQIDDIGTSYGYKLTTANIFPGTFDGI